jgi:ferredoxin-nitrite reductase
LSSSRQGAPPDPVQVVSQTCIQTHVQPPIQAVHPAICPGLFCPSVAQDGYLVRIRVPGGQLTPAQCRVLAAVCEAVGHASGNSDGNGSQNNQSVSATGHEPAQPSARHPERYLEVTNRANLQLRGLAGGLPSELLAQLQAVQLAAHPAIDHLRNLMASPTAGIDPGQLLDTRPLVAALNDHLAEQLDWAGLSAKFSIGFDGGERVSIQQQPNDLLFTAVRPNRTGKLALHLHLAGVDPAFANFLLEAEALELDHSSSDGQAWVKPVIATVTAVAQLYLDAVEPTLARKPRLKQILNQLGSDLPQRLQSQLAFPLRLTDPLPPTPASQRHLGVQAQNAFYSSIGLALPLGRLTVRQLWQLADLTEDWGLDLRLTPWRTLLLSQVPTKQVKELLPMLARLGLDQIGNAIWSKLVACSGSTGCAASATDTQADALALAQVLTTHLSTCLDTHRIASDLSSDLSTANPLEAELPTIHVSGCAKSCAHHGPSDLTLVGVKTATDAGYQLYSGWASSNVSPTTQTESAFGQLMTPDVLLPAAQLPQLLANALTESGLEQPSSNCLATGSTIDSTIGSATAFPAGIAPAQRWRKRLQQILANRPLPTGGN